MPAPRPPRRVRAESPSRLRRPPAAPPTSKGVRPPTAALSPSLARASRCLERRLDARGSGEERQSIPLAAGAAPHGMEGSPIPELASSLPWEADCSEPSAQGLPRFSVPQLVAAASSWGASGGGGDTAGGGPPPQLVLCGQLTSRRKLAKDLIFFDMRAPGSTAAAAMLPASGEATAAADAEELASEPVELVVSGREVDAATVEISRGLRLGDCIEVVCAIEPCDRAARSGKPSPGVAVQAQQPSLTPGATKVCVRVVSRWADTHGRLDFATANLACFKASQRSKSKQGRKAPAPEGERVKRRPGAKQRKHSRHLELCRQVRCSRVSLLRRERERESERERERERGRERESE